MRTVPSWLRPLVLAALATQPLVAQTTSAPLSESALLRQLSATLDSLAAADRFSGVVALLRDGAPVFQHAYGWADREAKRPNTVETAFNLGSINKIFTTIAIRQLADAGKLSLDSALGRYWPDYPNPEVARRVTVRQLLEHRSGIGGGVFGLPASGRRSSIRHNRDLLPLFVSEPLAFEPGSRQQYSNAGYVVLGQLIERLSAEDYYAYVRRHIYEPAGMTETAHYAVDSLPRTVATGYTRRAPDSTRLMPNTELLPGRGSAAGGGYSTARDLARFLQALRQRRIPGAPRPGIGIAGGAPGINAAAEGDLPGGYDIIVLSNLDPPSAEAVASRVREWLGARK